VGPRAVVGYKKQFKNYMTLEISSGLTYLLSSVQTQEVWIDEEANDKAIVTTHPLFANPELNVRVGWRLHGPKTKKTSSLAENTASH
jgi:hypothetical protein